VCYSDKIAYVVVGVKAPYLIKRFIRQFAHPPLLPPWVFWLPLGRGVPGVPMARDIRV